MQYADSAAPDQLCSLSWELHSVSVEYEFIVLSADIVALRSDCADAKADMEQQNVRIWQFKGKHPTLLTNLALHALQW